MSFCPMNAWYRVHPSDSGCGFLMGWIDRWTRYVQEHSPDAHTQSRHVRRQETSGIDDTSGKRTNSAVGADETDVVSRTENPVVCIDPRDANAEMMMSSESARDGSHSQIPSHAPDGDGEENALCEVAPDESRLVAGGGNDDEGNLDIATGPASLNASHGSLDDKNNNFTQHRTGTTVRTSPMQAHSPRREAWGGPDQEGETSLGEEVHISMDGPEEGGPSMPTRPATAKDGIENVLRPTLTDDKSNIIGAQQRQDPSLRKLIEKSGAAQPTASSSPSHFHDAHENIASLPSDTSHQGGGMNDIAPHPLFDPWLNDEDGNDGNGGGGSDNARAMRRYKSEASRGKTNAGAPPPPVENVRVAFPPEENAQMRRRQTPLDYGTNTAASVVRAELVSKAGDDVRNKDDIARLKRENSKLRRVMTLAHNLYARQRFTELGNVLSTYSVTSSQVGAIPPGGGDNSKSGQNIIRIGDRVVVGRARRLDGVIKYYGPTAFAPGDWVGIELDSDEGKNSGEVNGIRYFHSRRGRGVFVKAAMLRPDS